MIFGPLISSEKKTQNQTNLHLWLMYAHVPSFFLVGVIYKSTLWTCVELPDVVDLRIEAKASVLGRT